MIDFKDMRADWQIERRFKSHDDLRALGCSESLIAWLNPNPDHFHLMVDPEEWFWRDKGWYKHTPADVLDELHRLSGGTFCSMSVKAQCAMLGISMTTIFGKRLGGARGKWEGRDGPVSVEQLALEHFEAQGAIGSCHESSGFAAWCLAMNNFYSARTKQVPGFEKVNGRHVPLTPSEKHARDYLAALNAARENLDAEYEKHRAYYDKLWRPLSLNDVRAFADLVSWEFIETLVRLSTQHGARPGMGWPDLTLRQDGMLRFVEVKANDRLRGTQAMWIRSIAAPLSLNVSVVRVRTR